MTTFLSLSHIILRPFRNLKTGNVGKGCRRWELDLSRGEMLATEDWLSRDQGGPGGAAAPGLGVLWCCGRRDRAQEPHRPRALRRVETELAALQAVLMSEV